jgi:hypothetical protein
MDQIHIFCSPNIRTLTKIFKHTNLRIAYSVNNTITHKTSLKQQDIDNYNDSDVHKLKFKGCSKVCMGQTGRSFTARYAEHINVIKRNKDKSKHIPDHQHEGRKEVMKVVIGTFTKSFIFISITEQLNASINNILRAVTYCLM